ncbi:MAG: YmfQ family protein [Burkholderiaceae bacterium]|jgi:uncharacterized protein YmfQ (DUF2313 family)|nr:YmfQ family protein [Burkholderiaceae bacterium]
MWPRDLYINSATLEAYYGPNRTLFLAPRQEPALPSPFDADEFAAQLQALLPQGAAWLVEAGTVLRRLLGALAAEFARVDGRARALADESDPRRTSEMLDDWERMLGLPDACTQAASGLEERRAVVQAKVLLGAEGLQSPAYFVDLASRLGYGATVQEFASEQDAIDAGIPYSGSGWAHTWRLNVDAEVAVTLFRAGSARAGDPLRSWGIHPIECRVNHAKPAHTRALYAYSSHVLLGE